MSAVAAYRADAGDSLLPGVPPGFCTRVDVGRFDGTKVQTTPQGGLKVPAYLTREGVFPYANPDGTVRREYRPASEVFKADSLATLEDAPVTDLHNGLVSADNHGKLAKGHVRDIRQDDHFVAATVLVQDADMVRAVKAGDRKELSCGYVCKMDMTPGTTPAGEPYDAIQRDIKYNHVALLPAGAGRAGSEVSLRLDSATAVHFSDSPTKDIIVKTIRIDGKDYVIGSDEHLAKINEMHAAELTVARKDATDAKAAQVKAEAERDIAREDAKDARDPVKQAARVEARTTLEASARKVLGDEAKFDGKTDAEVREAVVSKAYPELKLDGLKPEEKTIHVQARFDALVAVAISASGGVSAARAAVIASQTPVAGDPAPTSYVWTPAPLAMSTRKAS